MKLAHTNFKMSFSFDHYDSGQVLNLDWACEIFSAYALYSSSCFLAHIHGNWEKDYYSAVAVFKIGL